VEKTLRLNSFSPTTFVSEVVIHPRTP